MKNHHNSRIPRDHWVEDWEKSAIVEYHLQHPLEGYRRLTYMMLDSDMVAVSPASTYRVLKAGGYLRRWNDGRSKKGTGFEQPLAPHEHWHMDISYLNVAGTFYYLCIILDGFSRFIIHWEIREAMRERDVECILQRARHQRQRPAVHLKGLQGAHPHHRHDPLQNVPSTRRPTGSWNASTRPSRQKACGRPAR